MITKAGAAKALKKRTAVVAKPLVLDPNFPHQNAFVDDPSRYIVAQCSRRAGKSNGLALRFFKTMEKYPGSQCVYLALTFDSARDILWPVLQELNDKYSLGCAFIESKLWVKHPNGATLKLMGADMKNFIKRLKGRKYPGVAIDEAQDFGTHLQSLVDDVLTPSISDYADGWIALTGTPGCVPQGYFFDITQQKKFGYSYHAWTMLENPYHPNTEDFLKDLLQRHQWEETHPTFLREYKNKWVLDVQSLWIQYKESTNHYQQLPPIPGDKWNYIMGIDIGFKDADAIAVLAWSEHCSQTFLVEELITTKQGLTELVEQIQFLSKKYDVTKMVIDEGGLGKKLAEEMRRRYQIPVQPADKARKQETVDILNDALRIGKFQAKSASRFAQDSYLVQIDWEKSTPDRIVIKKKPHSDIIDAVIYAFKESPAYTYQAPKKGPPKGSKEWAEQQSQEMWENAQDYFLEQDDMQRRINGTGWED